MLSRIVGFAGVDAKRSFQLEVAAGPPSREGWKIVGIEGDQRIRRIVVDALKRAEMVALEHHHQIGPDAPVRELGAKALRNGAEILADHHAAMRRALLRGYRQQGF